MEYEGMSSLAKGYICIREEAAPGRIALYAEVLNADPSSKDPECDALL